jgi:hypothetical protein
MAVSSKPDADAFGGKEPFERRHAGSGEVDHLSDARQEWLDHDGGVGRRPASTAPSSFDFQRALAPESFESLYKNTIERLTHADTGKQAGDRLPGTLPDHFGYSLEQLGLSREQLEAIRQEIRTKGQDPEDVVPDLMRHNRVLAIGETHWNPEDPQRAFGARIMRGLIESGATHLAVEMDKQYQPLLDEFMRTGQLDLRRIPPGLADQGYLAILQAARAASLELGKPFRIVAVDSKEREQTGRGPNRDQAMASEIGRILDADRNNRVVFWVGSAHLNKITDPNSRTTYQSASEILRQRYSIATIKDQGPNQHSAPLSQLTQDITRPTIISTRTARETGNLRTGPFDLFGFKEYYRDWDYIIMYPQPPRRY